MSVTRIGLAVVALVAAVAAVYAFFQALDERSAPPIVIEDATANLPIVVEVRGEVEAPGVFAFARSPAARRYRGSGRFVQRSGPFDRESRAQASRRRIGCDSCPSGARQHTGPFPGWGRRCHCCRGSPGQDQRQHRDRRRARGFAWYRRSHRRTDHRVSRTERSVSLGRRPDPRSGLVSLD